MQFFLISDNADTQMGMRLAGINGVVVHQPDEVKSALLNAADDQNTAIILITEKLAKLCRSFVSDFKLNRKAPLIVEIPDRHADYDVAQTISNYIRESIGLDIS